MKEIAVRTTNHTQFVNIDARVEEAIAATGIREGICHVFVPHTTAGVTINENADPDVPRDMLMALDKAIPWQDRYRHLEGNSAAHVKSSLVGASETVLVEAGNLVLGTWQSLFFCEFDGPRTRNVLVKVAPC